MLKVRNESMTREKYRRKKRMSRGMKRAVPYPPTEVEKTRMEASSMESSPKISKKIRPSTKHRRRPQSAALRTLGQGLAVEARPDRVRARAAHLPNESSRPRRNTQMGVAETVGVVRLSRRPGLRIHPGENLGNLDVAHAPIRGLVLVADLVLEVWTRAVDLLWHRERIDRITLTKKEATEGRISTKKEKRQVEGVDHRDQGLDRGQIAGRFVLRAALAALRDLPKIAGVDVRMLI